MSAHDHHEEMHPPAPVWMYVVNFLVLVVLTIVTYFVATKDLGALSTPVDYSTRNLEVLPPEETAPVVEKSAKS